MSDVPHSPATALSDAVRHKLHSARQQLQQFEFVRALLTFLAQAAVALLLVGLVDYLWPMPTVIRGLMLLGIAALGVTYGRQHQRRQAELDELAATRAVERAHPELGQRLRTALQFGTAGKPAKTQLVDALVQDTNDRAQRIDFEDTVRWSRLKPVALGLGAICLCGLAALAFWGETRTTLARLFMLPAHYTKLKVLPPAGPIAAGTDATVQVEVAGRPVQSVRLLVRGKGDTDWNSYPMTPPGATPDDQLDEVRGKLRTVLDNCVDDLQFKVVAGPVASARYQLHILQPLKQEAFAARVQPPGYTGLDPEEIADMDFTVVEESQIAWEMQLNRIPDNAQLIPMSGGAPGQQRPSLKMKGPTLLCDLATVSESQHYVVRAEAADGMKFQSEPIRIRVKKDHRPAVSFVKPPAELEVTPTTEVALQLDASDDFGLSKVGIEFQIGAGEKRTLWQDDLRGEETSLATVPVLFLENHALNYDDAITYYAYAEDNRQPPRRSRTELRFIDIRPYKREYEIVDGNCSGSKGSCLTLEELIARQRHNLRRTFANADRQPVKERVAARLAKCQKEIRAATAEFRGGWEQRFGSIPALHDAVDAMDRAAEQLDAKRLPEAWPAEETALAGLVQARKNFRKFIKNCSTGQFGQCQRFDNEMRQKLQPPENAAETSKSLAKTRQQIRELAKNQRKWSEEVTPSGGGGAQIDRQSNSMPNRPQKPSGSQSASTSGQQQSSQLVQAQQAASQLASQLQSAVREEEMASDLSAQRMEAITEAMAQAWRQLQSEDPLAAAKQALHAANLLDQLDEHLRGLGTADLGQRLALTQQMASRLAEGEANVAQQIPEHLADSAGDLAETQRGLATQTETLSDLVKHMEADALGENPALRRQLADLQDVHQVEQLARDMQRVADDVAANRSGQAERGARTAADSLNNIARSLGELHRQYVQPQLERLLAAEARAAELLDAMESDGSATPQANVAARFEQLRRELAELRIAVPDGKADSGNQGQGSTQGAVGSPSGPPRTNDTAGQLAYPVRSMEADLRQILLSLQSSIQEAILLTSRMDADQPVPPKYRSLVDEYYQALSDDLR